MKTYALEFLIVIIIIGLTVCLDVLYQVDHVKDNDRTKTNTGLERAHQMKHIIHEMHVMEDHHSMYVLTTGERKFVEPKGFSVQKVFGSDLSGVVAHTYDEGFGPKKWPEGARRVACGHVAIWKRIASECNGWCFVSEDDAKWPDVPLPMLPANGFVSYFRSAVCNAATVSYSADYLRVVKSVVRGRCMPYGAVAYAMSSSFAKTLLSELPMKKPVDHFLWEQSVKHQVAFVARDYYVKHVKGKSLRESVVNTESTSVKVVSPGPVKVSENLKPIHISNGNRKVKCDVPCYWPKISGGIIKSLTIDELGIQLIMSMEGEINHPSLRLSTKSSKRIFATTRFDSEIPMPYYDWPWTMYLHPKPTGLDIWSKNGIQTPHVPWESVSKAGVFIARNCKSKSGREKLVEELMTLLPVKSVSSCLNNLRLPPAELADKRKLMRQYAFYFAFENEITQDYISEKLWSTFGAGVLPVYFGAPNIKDHVPEHSIVNVADYDSRADLANHLKDILENKDLYDSYHEWRYKPLPDFFVRKYNFTHVHSECRTCRWASAKLNGLKWDAEQQAVSYPRVVHAGTRETKAKTSDYILYKDVDQIGFDIDGEPTVSAREFCSKRRDCKAYNHMGWAKSSVSNVQRKRGVYLYVKREHALSLIPSPSVGPLTNVNCDFEMDEAVDIVYSWVNWTAPSYISQMRNEGLLYGDESESHMNYEKPADDSAYEELRYSIASLLKYGSTNSIHKIYVVINPVHGPPSWLNTSHPKIEIVHHSKILPKVPTNNAWAISTALHRIPGLGKWFLALNDDVILNRKLKLDRLTIGCPRSELAHTHCPTLRNTCLMHALEDQFGERVGKVYEHRRKSTLKYRPDIVLWLEHHNWLVENGHATFEPNSNWFGLVNTNEWRKDSEWVYRRWDQVLKKAENSMWINFQGPGISWEYPENQAIRRQFHSWISGQGFTKHFDAMRDTPVNPREITSVKIFASSTSSGTVIKTVNSNNINEVAKECAEHPNCEAFERMRPGNYRLMSGTGMVSGSHDVFVMREEPSCSHSVSPDLDLLIPSSGRHILCDTLKSIECHSSYLSHCPNGPNVFIYGARAISCDNVQAKCIRYLEKAPPLEIKRGIATERQLQTSDFISLLNAVTGQGSVMLMDDDFLWCSEYVEYIQSAFENQFPIAFLGQGSNGMLMNKADARGLAAYLTKHRASNNVDILQYRYAKSLGKCMARSEIRLSRHKGIKSSFARLENGFWVDDNFCGMPMMPKHVKNVFGVSWNQFYDKMWRTTGCKKHRRAPVSPALSEGNPVPLVESNIPKMIHMTGRGHPNREYRSWKDKNPDWDVIWYSDEQVSNYVKEKYPEYESTWRKMSKIARFDFWRILVVHREGGLYVDSDVTCNRPIAEWDIRPGDKFISGTECWGCNDIELQLIQFAFMAVPEHPVLKYAMVHIATNAWRRPSYARHYENAMKNVFHSSGPGALTHGLLQYLFSRKHDPDCVTPHGRCEDVSVLPWWWWGYMDQHSKDHAATSKPAGSGGHYFLHGFRASWTHDKINQHATTEIIKEQPPKQIEPQGKFAYLFFATSTQHACAVETMVQRLIELGSSSSVDFMCVVPNDKIRFANNRIQKIVHTETQVQNDYFKFAMLKLYGFTMYKYDRIIHMDADSYVQKNLDHLFLLPDVPLAAPVANWENEFCISGALLVIKPDRHTWQTKIQPSIASYARSGKSEMNLLNEVFEHRIGSNRILPELLILPSKYLTLSTEFTHPEPYHTKMADLWKETVVFHFSGGYGKPWAPKNVAAMNDNTRKLYELARGDECAVLPKSHKSTTRKELATRKEKSVPNEPRIAVVVPTYNRRGYAKLCAKALSKTIDHNDIYVFDDHSDQFSTDDLQSWFGTTNVRQNEKRLKPDKQARSIVEWFVDTEYDWLVTLDSDLIVRPDWLSVLKSHLHLTEGVISLYHSSNVANHRTIGCENGICEMKSLGNAGVVWSRGLASKMLQTVSDGGGFDWGWSDWLRKNDVTQYAFEKSLVLHVGMHGTWGADSRREKSKGFDVSILSEPVQALAKLYLKGLHPDKENKYTRGVTPKFRIQRLG